MRGNNEVWVELASRERFQKSRYTFGLGVESLMAWQREEEALK
jgi:hypothetical protein